tara:strand:+ start:1779 stop:2663 length:885 start_codon:yes stop_codon:yes gene_type:complete
MNDSSTKYLINLPPFYLRGIDFDRMNSLVKIFYIFLGKFFAFITKYTNKKIFCALINLFYRKDGKIFYSDKNYVKKTSSGREIAFPNKRVLRLVNKFDLQVQKFREAYLLDSVPVTNNDTIIDCGANIGELNLSYKERGISLNYIAFEPEKSVFNCLETNNKEDNNELFNIGLSNKNGIKKFYLDTEGGNSSFVKFGSEEYNEIEVARLDKIIPLDKQIKLLKIDAEGYEPEVLDGAKNILPNIEYISVDFGGERGANEEMTIIEVNDFLYENNYKLIGLSKIRMVGLYKRDDS